MGTKQERKHSVPEHPMVQPLPAKTMPKEITPFQMPVESSAFPDTSLGSAPANGAKRPREREKKEPSNEILDDMVRDTNRFIIDTSNKKPLLTKEQEVDLFRRIEAGRLAEEKLARLSGQQHISPEARSAFESFAEEASALQEDARAARDIVWERNQGLVVSIATRYMGRGMPLLDMIQEGHFGLARTIEKFDYHRGHKFSTYATWWIRQAILRAIADRGRIIKLPVHVVEQLDKLIRVKRRLEQQLEREPTLQELAVDVGITIEKVLELFAQSEPESIDAVIGETDSSLSELIESEEDTPEQRATKDALRKNLENIMESLTSREKIVLRGRFGWDDGRPRTLEELGDELGVSRERIRHIELKVLEKLRDPKNGFSQVLWEYYSDAPEGYEKYENTWRTIRHRIDART